MPTKFHEVPDLMRNSELGKARVKKNVEAIKQQTAELFPYTGDKRLVFLFLACEVHPASKDMELFLGQVIEALVLVKQVQAHAPVKSNLISYLENGSLLEHIREEVNSTVIYNTLIKNFLPRFKIAEKLVFSVLSAAQCSAGEDTQSRALALLTHFSMSKMKTVLAKDAAHISLSECSDKLIVDSEHTLAAKCVLGESGRVFSKMKRATRICTYGRVQFASDSEVLKTENAKNIGVLPRIMTKGAGRYNTIEEIHERYLMSQSYVMKIGDIFFENPDDNNEVQILSIFQNDGAEMCFERNSLSAVQMFVPACNLDDKSKHFFQDPALLIDVSMMDGKEEITVMHYMLGQIFSGYDPEKIYDVICTCQEHCESEGQFPAKMKQHKNRSCVLCDKYNLKDSRRLRTNYEGTRNVGVLPEIKACVLSGADYKTSSTSPM